MVSNLQLCQRALVSALLAVAAVLNVAPSVNRDSDPPSLRAAYGTVLRKAQGRTDGEALKRLRAAKVSWEQALNYKGPPPGRPAGNVAVYRIESSAVLLTYQSFTSLDQWRRFVNSVKANMSSWNVKYWCATLETCKSGRLHAHLMLQFWVTQDRSSRAFAFEGIHPNVSAHDYLGEGVGRRNPQQSIDRGFFYVFAKKLGTVVDEGGHDCVTGNYVPAWCNQDAAATYRVQGKWPEALWKHYRLDHATYEEYLFLTRCHPKILLIGLTTFAPAKLTCGFATVVFHAKKKLTKAEWIRVLQAGKLASAIKSLRPVKKDGPWHVLCDNEAFLVSRDCQAEHRKAKVNLWRIPAKSPDLNPIERFWAYLRKRLNKLDLQDALKKRPWIGKLAYKTRIKNVLKSAHAQDAAKRIARGYIKTCREETCLKGDVPPCTMQAGAPFCTRPCLINATLNFGIVEDSDPPFDDVLEETLSSLPLLRARAQRGDGLLAQLVTWFVPSTVGFAPSADWVEAVLWLSPAGARTGLHQDDEPCSVLYQVYGRKRLRLFSPLDTKHLKANEQPHCLGEHGTRYSQLSWEELDTLSSSLQPLELVLEAGDAIFIPNGWWHAVEALGPDPAVSISGRGLTFCEGVAFLPFWVAILMQQRLLMPESRAVWLPHILALVLPFVPTLVLMSTLRRCFGLWRFKNPPVGVERKEK
eukprot:s2657_g9.t3